jgi:membrane-associated phospholipid phosphatase
LRWLQRSAVIILPVMRQFLLTLPGNVIACFKGRMILWHIVAILLTLLLVMSDFDWQYFLATRSPGLRAWMFPAVLLGMFLPIILPLLLIVCGSLAKRASTVMKGWAVGQAAFIGWLISAAYKVVTGRAHPGHAIGVDISHVFRFGFLRGGIFWGWPSSHATVAFAMAFALFTLLQKQKSRRWAGWVAMAYAFYVGIGVSMTIHWFSDFVAGAIFGTVIGVTVGKSFLRQQIN